MLCNAYLKTGAAPALAQNHPLQSNCLWYIFWFTSIKKIPPLYIYLSDHKFFLRGHLPAQAQISISPFTLQKIHRYGVGKIPYVGCFFYICLLPTTYNTTYQDGFGRLQESYAEALNIGKKGIRDVFAQYEILRHLYNRSITLMYWLTIFCNLKARLILRS